MITWKMRNQFYTNVLRSTCIKTWAVILLFEVWGSLTLLGCGVLVFMWWGIFETLPEDSRKPFHPGKWLREYFTCFMLLKDDFVLMKGAIS